MRLERSPLSSSAAGDTHRRCHYAETVFVMFAGMFVLMAPAGALLSAFGTSCSGLSPAMNVFAMALTMTVPMVAWMRYRGA
jgi:divalent metal cation (Fe/Co/Zn/Cd) transporter